MADARQPHARQPGAIHGRVIGVSIAAALGGFLFGFDTAVINGAVDALSDAFDLGVALKGFAVSSALIGCALGAWFAGPLANRLGRVPTMVTAAVLFFISAIGSGLAFGVIDLIVWRVIGGLGVGAASVIAPAYIAEVSPARVRGRLGSLQQLAIVTGIFVALLSDAMLANFAGGAAGSLWGLQAWRWMFMAEAIPALVYGLMALRLPESPRYLVARGHLERAGQVLTDVTGEIDVGAKIDEITGTINTERQESLRDLRGHRFGLKPIVWVGILLSVFQQFVGINVIFYYSTTLWRSVGFDESDALTITVITSVTNIVVTIVAILLVDRVGRRLMLMVGSIGMAATLGLMAVAFSFGTVDAAGEVALAEPWSTIALVSANAFVVFFGATWGPLVWVLLGEMFPNSIRAGALAVAAAAQWVANFFISTTFPAFAEIGLTFAYGFYAFFALLSFFFVYFKVAETKGRELESMTEEVIVQRRGARYRA
ncbi:sugar porter family MFS transporter [Microbacterium esteraromaticum]|uniref:Sugar porter family MFS transporter n=1 Tax=Microbacterium esteraromaticum TaxID=57043 RepID=A0A939IUI5_9MICO|nr:sugar porter family MFS transporter [Microbacterium esteraromaticum]MBN8204683.1 sugar porter family MFS transporter [Microbacterium esteraromaticum]MBN8414837.1 sugar porter family MFS transporter [Microbacterium esteraromaticum]